MFTAGIWITDFYRSGIQMSTVLNGALVFEPPFGYLSSIQMAFENRIIWCSDNFQPFEYLTTWVFRSPLYLSWVNTRQLSKSLKFQISTRSTLAKYNQADPIQHTPPGSKK